MPVQPDFIAYHQSLASEFNANKDQIRNLIGDAHWPSDGGHKEAILRRVLQNKLPDTFRVGTGFFTDTFGPSSQIDILITDASRPTLFRNGDFLIVTPDCVKAIIEVKTKLIGPKKISEALSNLANNVEKVRRYNPECWAGLFVYEGPEIAHEHFSQQSRANSRNLLNTVNVVSNESNERTVHCISLGSNIFIRFWPHGNEHIGGVLHRPGWQSYIFNNDIHRGLSPAYFVGNLVMHLTDHEESEIRRAWFPIQDGNGKEDYRLGFIEMGHHQIINQNQII